MKFRIGQRVRVTADEGLYRVVGKIGTIRGLNGREYSIGFYI